jgi:hypothetical protein
VTLTNGERFSTPLTTVTINNANPTAAHIVETATSKIQTVAANEANTVLTSHGATVTIPAGALPADDRLVLTVVEPLQAPEPLPEDVAGLLVDIELTSGLTAFLGISPLRSPMRMTIKTALWMTWASAKPHSPCGSSTTWKAPGCRLLELWWSRRPTSSGPPSGI